MFLLHGNSHTKRGDYEGAIQLFEHAQAQMRHYEGRSLLVISLVSFLMGVLQRIEITHRLRQISGWRFDNLDVTIRQRLCEALYAAGRTKDAGESLLKLVNTFDEEANMSEPIAAWISGEFTFTCLFSCIRNFSADLTQQCLSTPEIDDAATSKATSHDNVPILPETLNSPTPTPLLREWAKATLVSRSWADALATAARVSIFFFSCTPHGIDTLGVEFVVPRFAIYQVICERLEAIHRITHASECFRQMVDELALEILGKKAKWVLSE